MRRDRRRQVNRVEWTDAYIHTSYYLDELQLMYRWKGSSRLCAARAEKLCQFRRNIASSVNFRRELVDQPQQQHPSVQQAAPISGSIASTTGSRLFQRSQSSPRYGGRSCRTTSIARAISSMQTQQPGSLPDYRIDPYQLLEDDLKNVYEDIRRELVANTSHEELRTIATYYFGGQGKALRPMVAILMARAINYDKDQSGLLASQRQVAMISEMIHNASLVHDDVVDQSDFRRGKPSVNALWSQKKVTMAGDFILAVASMMIARLQNDDVTLTLSQVITDLVQGEFMQLGSKETENERFAHYLTKTYRKTASLIANSAKAVAMLGGADERLAELAFQYGRNIGLAFQLVDDLLDFVSSSDAMGKPTAADLKLGLATAPVLFACERFPELNPMIMRRFQEPGDVEKAFELVHKSQGLEQTRFLAKKHCVEAVRLAQTLAESPYQKSLMVVSDLVINRIK
ncbi:decaprenyl-diphosphate synthase subunit 1 isoform X1 [Nasonia vitripennis]|uniref:All trans-polyprenyl-diphosphate synthase PDSS1 n=1 Tax=Nasonia vitripennis TaxID=7425 RepID=A0A7M7H947_NASVI|nr:decaprenyl-diphosphate synthase subunit 1 isoform X1 [Nasonia vitripennis]